MEDKGITDCLQGLKSREIKNLLTNILYTSLDLATLTITEGVSGNSPAELDRQVRDPEPI